VAALALSTTAVAGSKVPGSGAKKRQLTPVTYMLSFFPSESNAGEFAALDKGYWAKQGLEVKIVPGLGGGAVVQQAAAGNVQFTRTFGITLAQQVARGANVTAIAALSPLFDGGVDYWPDKGISTPKDLEGKTYATIAGGFTDVLFPLFAQRAGFDASKVNQVHPTPAAQVALFDSWQVDALGDLKYVLPTHGTHNGVAPKIFQFRDYGINMISLVLLTSARYAQDNPSVVQKFVTGLMQGIAWACANPRQAVTGVRTHFNSNLSAETGLAYWQATCGNNRVPEQGNHPLGWMPLTLWQQTVQLMRDNPGLGGPNAPAANTLFTNRFANVANVAPPKVTVPKLAGKTLAQATKALARGSLRLGKVTRAASARVARGKVISQKPAGGRRVPAGTTVDLVISRGRA
jgi:NitT/TauT family transport system substrate-binding protein